MTDGATRPDAPTDEAARPAAARASDAGGSVAAGGADAALAALRGAVAPAHVLTGEALAPFLVDWRGLFRGAALCAVRPGSAAELAVVLRVCAAHGLAAVPQGGNTGLCGGATPDASGRAVVVLTSRLNRVRAIDPANATMTLEAGVVLATAQAAAREAGFLFPLSLGAEGSCTVGGNLATNAGGTAVLRYGNARDLTLGLEVVTAEGQLWDGLRSLRKDNTGYDLCDLFIGSEGTLGVITAAVVKLFPLPAATRTAFLALPSLEAGLALLARARSGFGAALTGFEAMNASSLDLVTRVFPAQRHPFAGEGARAPWFALAELSDPESEAHARERFEAVLGEALEAGEALDAVIAESEAQSAALWHLRESVTLAQGEAGATIKHDVAVPISAVPDFVAGTDARLAVAFPGLVHVTFGHLGDGNLHYNLAAAPPLDDARLKAAQDEIFRIVHDEARARGGSISAEHGIGQLKRAELARTKDPLELELMRRIKRALDPAGILNPGKVLPD